MIEKKMKESLIGELNVSFPQIFSSNPKDYLIEQLKSKRNEVYEIRFKNPKKNIPQKVILKRFIANTFDKEISTLKKLKAQNLSVPSILSYKKPYLILQKIEGKNLCDFINLKLTSTNRLSKIPPKPRDQLVSSIKLLAEWFAIFHKKNIWDSGNSKERIVLNKGDVRLRDFLIKPANDKVYGVDFENVYRGNYLEDLSGICCSLLDTNPGIFEISEPYHKIDLIILFLKEYHRINIDFISFFDFETFSDLLLKQIDKVSKRRNLKKMDSNWEEIITKIQNSVDF
ncbi:MAG: hypothetical protein EU547_02960 [Promethearchaeota archaeon]|nr:MAG: hypothetical protein EU547_02960 [Candidatus Lokiarchaeota archaeon]